jgi:hypothetical protein
MTETNTPEKTEPETTVMDPNEIARINSILECIDEVAVAAAVNIIREQARSWTMFTVSIAPEGKIYEAVKKAYLDEAKRREFDATRYVEANTASAINRALNSIVRSHFGD